MQRSALRNLTVGLVAAVTLGATASFAVADDDLGLAAGEHTISIPGVGDVMLTVDADGHLEVFTAPEGFALVDGSLDGGDDLEFSLKATSDAAASVDVEFEIDADGQLSVFGQVTEAGADVQDVTVDDEDDSVDSVDSVDSEPSLDEESEPSEPSEDSEPSADDSEPSEESVDSEPSEESVDSEPSADDSEPSADDSPESEDSEA